MSLNFINVCMLRDMDMYVGTCMDIYCKYICMYVKGKKNKDKKIIIYIILFNIKALSNF